MINPTPRQLSTKFRALSKKIHALKALATTFSLDGCSALAAHALAEIKYFRSQQDAMMQLAVDLGYNRAC